MPDARRANVLDDSQAALRMLMARLDELAPQHVPSLLGYSLGGGQGGRDPLPADVSLDRDA